MGECGDITLTTVPAVIGATASPGITIMAGTIRPTATIDNSDPCLPWGFAFDNRTFVIKDPAAYQALDKLMPYLYPELLKVYCSR